VLTSNDEDGAEALEVGKGTRVVPVLDSEVALIADTTTVDDDTENNESQTSSDLDGGQDEFDYNQLALVPSRPTKYLPSP
jgi:hypothetical protein